MNIFALNNCPRQSARDLCNKHVPKMFLESAQILSNALHLRREVGEAKVYKPTHCGHPCTIWAASSGDNFRWLLSHAQEIGVEYARRFGKVHKTSDVMHTIACIAPVGDEHAHTPFAQAMPEEWKCDDGVTAYRCYYVAVKSQFARWAPRSKPPVWWPFTETTE